MAWYGMEYPLHPDLAERFANGRPLNPEADPKVWYSFNATGYTDFPGYKASQNLTA